MDHRIGLTVAALEYVFCLIGLLANILVCAIIIKHRKSTFSNTFYSLAIALAVPDCVHLCSELFCALPAVFYGLENTPKWFLASCGYFADVSFFAIEPLMLVIAVNRYIAVCYFETYKRYFTVARVKILIAICYVFSFFIPSLMYGCGCYYDFNHAWLFACHETPCTQFSLNFNSAIANSIALSLIIIYVLIYFQHRRVRRRVAASSQQESESDKRRRAKEAALMFQFGLIAAVLIGYLVFFWIFIYLATNEPCEMILNFLVNLNSCVSPFLYLAFGSEIRSRLPWKKVRPTLVSAVTTSKHGPAQAPNQPGQLMSVPLGI